MKKSLAILILGRSGSGKGTQSKLIMDNMGFDMYLSTGDLFREVAQKDSLVGRKLSSTLAEGGLPDDWIASFLWQRELVEKIKTKETRIIFDGVARRLNEAKLLDEVMTWLEIDIVPILIDITKEEAFSRLKARGRSDDTDEGISKRLDWYEKEVVEVIDYYKSKGRLTEVSGMRNIEEVFDDIKMVIEEIR